MDGIGNSHVNTEEEPRFGLSIFIIISTRTRAATPLPEMVPYASGSWYRNKVLTFSSRKPTRGSYQRFQISVRATTESGFRGWHMPIYISFIQSFTATRLEYPFMLSPYFYFSLFKKGIKVISLFLNTQKGKKTFFLKKNFTENIDEILIR